MSKKVMAVPEFITKGLAKLRPAGSLALTKENFLNAKSGVKSAIILLNEKTTLEILDDHGGTIKTEPGLKYVFNRVVFNGLDYFSPVSAVIADGPEKGTSIVVGIMFPKLVEMVMFGVVTVESFEV